MFQLTLSESVNKVYLLAHLIVLDLIRCISVCINTGESLKLLLPTRNKFVLKCNTVLANIKVLKSSYLDTF